MFSKNKKEKAFKNKEKPYPDRPPKDFTAIRLPL